MARRSRTPSFVTEIELQPTGKQAKTMRAPFKAAHQVYRACIGEARRLLNLLSELQGHQRARRLPKSQARNQLFYRVEETIGFSEFALNEWATQFTRSQINEHLGVKKVKEFVTNDRAWLAIVYSLYAFPCKCQ